ncbi:MAG: S9 family peptidase [Gammaproteobacteria bacterium]|nr:S9 family peptidase [Gammaproteobacteria bacterium]MBU2057591.1 S9 family peptidase [Gammaproteobacteria bacterium]MBU2176351.1 S9 family peptidase [Gammaproteobacteria bacterium]MBU2245952.1 S9 family peptidase [Gammaproteobacteria bacterium]MBU2345473.1 S9 family peptidase [Gammaproteobacteria bacterium]
MKFSFSALMMMVAAGVAQATTEPLTAQHVWQVARPGALTLSPNGQQLALTVTRYDLATDKGDADIHILDLRTQQLTALTQHPDSDSAPAWSPDGRQLVFLSKRGNEHNQLFLLPLTGGEAKALTKLPVAVQQPKWFPDGQRILFLAHVPKGFNGDFAALAEQLKQRKDNKVTAKVTENRVYRHWDRWLTDDSYPHLFSINIHTGEIADLTPGWDRWFSLNGDAEFDISMDGRQIAVSAVTSAPPFDQINHDILMVKTDGSGEFVNITADNPASDNNPKFSPDGKSLVYGAQRSTFFTADNNQLIRFDVKAGQKTNLTKDWDISADDWEFGPNGTLYFRAADKAKSALYSMPLAGGQVQQLLRQADISQLQVGQQQQLYMVQHSMNQMPEVYSLDNKGRTLKQLSRLNQELQQSIHWGKTEDISFAGADGKMVQAYITYPPNFDASKKWPLLNVLHGGPHSYSGDSFSYRWNSQVFAAAGYVVIQPNFHGSTSFGQAFAESIHGEHPTKPFMDSEAAVDYMISRGFIDATRLAAAGGSYGGYLVSWIAGHTERYKALINHAGVYNLMGQFASDGTSHRVHTYGGAPWSGLDTMLQWSPAMFADKFVTPMLIMHGEQDYRVPVTQGLEIYGVYKGKGLDARLLYFPNENHWILKPNNSIFWFNEFTSWLQRYVPAGPTD